LKGRAIADCSPSKGDPPLKRKDENSMKKYEVTMIASYEKTLEVYGNTPEEAEEKIINLLLQPELIRFLDGALISVDASLTEVSTCEKCGSSQKASTEQLPQCKDCFCSCPQCGACLCENAL
jgi:hypothetical protein